MQCSSPVRRFLAVIFAAAPALLLPRSSAAQNTLSVSGLGLGVNSIGQLIDGVINVAELTIVPICVAIFTAGAFLWVLSPASENLRTQGKDLMIGALVGVGVVFGARGIMNTVLFFIYA